MTDEAKAPQLLEQVQGQDCPQEVWNDARRWKKCQLTINDKCLSGQFQIVLKSQQPRVVFTLESAERSQIIFTAKNCTIDSGYSSDHAQFVQQHREMMDLEEPLYFLVIRPSEVPAMPSTIRTTSIEDPNWQALCTTAWSDHPELVIWSPYQDKNRDKVQRVLNWLEGLVQLIYENKDATGKKHAHWWYFRSLMKNLSRAPPMPWLRDPKTERYKELEPHDAFFIDDEDRDSVLVQASKNERHVQEVTITDCFNVERGHAARIKPAGQGWWYVFVQALETPQVPMLSPSMRTDFAFIGPHDLGRPLSKCDLNCWGSVIDYDGKLPFGDFAIATRARLSLPQDTDLPITLVVSVNLMPVTEQITALGLVGTATVFGDGPENAKKGYSLRKMVLGHGTEFDRDNYFEIDFRQLSKHPSAEHADRIQLVETTVPLDPPQLEAARKSTIAIPCGVHLVQGPPGTGKTRTALRIILFLASLGIKVLLVAGSNKGVDNLFHPVFKACQQNTKMQENVGDIIRFRSPSSQISTMRINGVNKPPGQKRSELSEVERDIENCQMHTLVLKYAEGHRDDEECSVREQCQRLLKLLEKDELENLRSEEEQQLRNAHEHIMKAIFQMKKTTVVASTLSTCSQEWLRLGFEPDVLICDESGQCLEGDVMIPLTKFSESLRAFIQLGDPDQLPPTVISEGRNELARYLKRSLMARLRDCGYPLSKLNINYRNHPQILDLYNRVVYDGLLSPHDSTSAPDRVGDTWDAFTRSRHHFYGQKLDSIRRLFVSVEGLALREANGTSFENQAQAEVIARFLAELYRFEGSHGNKIGPRDVMVISPYKAQRNYISAVLKAASLDVHDNLTVDASQGQESDIVLLSLTKPAVGTKSVGFVGDKSRLNVALSRARKVLVVIGNLQVWNKEFRQDRRVGARFLRSLLDDAIDKRNVLTWIGPQTVTETYPNAGYAYRSHVQEIDYQSAPSRRGSLLQSAPRQPPARPSSASSMPSSALPQGLSVRPPAHLPARPPPLAEENQVVANQLFQLELNRTAAMGQVHWYNDQMRQMRQTRQMHRDSRNERSRSPRRSRSPPRKR